MLLPSVHTFSSPPPETLPLTESLNQLSGMSTQLQTEVSETTRETQQSVTWESQLESQGQHMGKLTFFPQEKKWKNSMRMFCLNTWNV